MKFKEGTAYRIEFWDHCTNKDHPFLCEVFGRVLKDSKDHVLLSWWNVLDDEDKEVVDDNREKVVILKSTIKKKRKLTV